MKLQWREDDDTLVHEETYTTRQVKFLRHNSSGNVGIWAGVKGYLKRRLRDGRSAIVEEARLKVEDGTIVVEGGDKEQDVVSKWMDHDDYKDAEAREQE